MTLSAYKDSELIAELYERTAEPTFEERMQSLINDSFERIDEIIDLACDDLEKIRPRVIGYSFGRPICRSELGLAESAAHYSHALHDRRAIDTQAQITRMANNFLGMIL